MKKFISIVSIAVLLLVSVVSVGAAEASFNPYEKIYAIEFTDAGYNNEYDTHVRPSENSSYFVESKDIVAYARPHEYIVFENVDFGSTGAVKFKAHVGAAVAEGATHDLAIRLDSADGELLGELKVTNTGGWLEWETQETDVKSVSGTHDLYLVFSENVANISWFQFEPAASNPKTGDYGVWTYALMAGAAGAGIVVVARKAKKQAV